MSGLSITPASCILSRKSDEAANSSAFCRSAASNKRITSFGSPFTELTPYAGLDLLKREAIGVLKELQQDGEAKPSGPTLIGQGAPPPQAEASSDGCAEPSTRLTEFQNFAERKYGSVRLYSRSPFGLRGG
jgi:hypothetical protein